MVTGGCGGIGSAFVARFVNDGAKVAIIDVKASSELLKAFGDKVKLYQVDVSSREACFKIVEEIAHDFGKINHLVNAVAYFGSKVIYISEN